MFAAGVVLEAGIRLLGTTDADGNFLLAGHRIRPFRVPYLRLRELTDVVKAGSSFLAFDPDTGWAPRPLAESSNGLYHYDSRGIRVARSATVSGAHGRARRIVLIGDSFMHGDDVPYEDSLGALLQASLAKSPGLGQIEVLNLAVPAFGMDQALLRFEKLGVESRPELVVFGFQAENMWRNQNVFRCFYEWPCQLPFSKPRFVLDGTGLRLVNHPALSPEDTAAALVDIARSPLAADEAFFDVAAYRDGWATRFRLIAAIATKLDWGVRVSGGIVVPGARAGVDGQEIAIRIVRRLRAVVEAAGASLVVMHVPIESHLEVCARGEAVSYESVLVELRRSGLVDPVEAMLAMASKHGMRWLFVGKGPGGHYSRCGNETVASVLGPKLAEHLR